MDKQIVHLFVFNTLADWETGFAIAGINNPAFQKHPRRYRVQTVGLDAEPVMTIGGVTILPDLTLDELESSAMLILPGGEAWDAGKNAPILESAKALLEADIPIAAICGATAGLARAGILDDKPHTSNAPEYLQATNYRGATLYQNQPAVTAGNVITASSTAPLDFAYHIFKQLDLYDAQILEAWYGLFKTGDVSYYATLQKLAASSTA
ncbi:type 1 glutamine amidotransferase family protein [Chroococcidiopsis sp. CCNUC1]|uniref:type 1 glutamine amidotransferase family protein n=1 Tax=Chroococcidiopsis sp. CCNUC1 TaxID=2653189 RepID=UPI000D070830|nr:type 1 glutamine amidotransferase family protein [Chroococcidiopsis sp. CCNUC1]PSB49506.1 glutamine amidotransferase [Cyanosarcina cf. burmensis CCALA 770]URD53845.1 glutamine amidotransferase [Chroococcidiopsis sp. CCNUC1]